MPKRDFLMGASEVVWGVTDQANGTAYSIDFGDGSAPVAGNVADRSYIAFNHTYATSGTFTVALTVGAETANVDVNVYDAATLSAFDLRGLNINRAIQDGLRYLWTSQINRATNFPAGVTTYWGGSYPDSHVGLTVLAFENQGYTLPNSNAAPTGIYEKYVVQRGLNWILDRVRQQPLTVQTAGDPCVGGVEAAPCVGLVPPESYPGYSTALVTLPLAASGALARTVQAGIGAGNANYVVGKTYGEILQRLSNTIAWGQNDGTNQVGEGGWYYYLANNTAQSSDGSTVGWSMLALLDAAAAGTTVPAFVKSEFTNHALPNGLNTDGSFDYQADGNPASDVWPNNAKTAIGLQGLFFSGAPLADARVTAGTTFLSNYWLAAGPGFVGACQYTSTYNKGCAYGMFNTFKALKLYGVATLPGVGRAAGPGPIPADDWYADYQDWLVTNQNAPQNMLAGDWPYNVLGFSGFYGGYTPLSTAMAELILAPVALIQPDPTLFSSVGLSPASAVNPPGTSHTVTAEALSTNLTPVPGATVHFTVLTGQNAGKSGINTTDANGHATFTYQDTGGGPYPSTDTIQAAIGNLKSNIVSKTWKLVCDTDGDGDADRTDLLNIRAANGQTASGPDDPRDANGDGVINVADYRYCSLHLTP